MRRRGTSGWLSAIVLPYAATVAATLATASVSTLAASLLELDPTACRVTWTLGATLHTVEGTFVMERGEIRFDAGTGTASGLVEIRAASGESGNKSRDRKMHEKVLESAKYPVIVFHPERLSGDFDPRSGGDVSLQGIIEIHGIREKITVKGQVAVSGGRLTGTAGMTIPFVAWGLEDPSAFILRVEKEVEITLHLDGTLTPAPADEAPTPPE